MLSKTKFLWSSFSYKNGPFYQFGRQYAKKSDDDGCRKALVDLPPVIDPDCPEICKRRHKKKEGILHRIKMRVIEGGTNFGTPFRRLQCKELQVCKETEPKDGSEPKALIEPKKVLPPVPAPRPGVQVAVLGADTAIGQYVALLLKQCPCIKKLRLYEATCTQCSKCNRELNSVVQDLHHIDTNCLVQAFSCACCELERCLQNSDIVLMLDSAFVNATMNVEKKFCEQATIVKKYTDAIATECPKAFVIVCATPIDCMVPLVAETLKETGWYDPRKVMGSLAVQEMRASTLAAKALSLEPYYTRVPCVGGTEGNSLVPLFSKAVDYFEFTEQNAEIMTRTVRDSPVAVTRFTGPCTTLAALSEAHALAGLVSKVAHALLCKDLPRVTGFVETDAGQVISPARYIASTVEIGGAGIARYLGLPKMNDFETTLVNLALNDLCEKLKKTMEWHCKYCRSSGRLDACQFQFFSPGSSERFDDCAYANLYLAIDVMLNDKGICQRFDFPAMSDYEQYLTEMALPQIVNNVEVAQYWHSLSLARDIEECKVAVKKYFFEPKDKLLNKLEENEPELATSPEEECVICVNAKATMQTSPCGHRVVCRRCFVKTIQMAVSQRLLPLRCVICRAKILRLRQTPRLVTSKSWQVTSGSSKSWGVPGSVSSYSVGARSVPASASLYSVTSGESSLSGVSSVSSNSGGHVIGTCSTKLCGGAKCGGACLGAVPRPPPTAQTSRPRQPASNSLRRSQHSSMKARLQEYQVHSYTGGPVGEPSGRLPPIREFQREFREGRRESAAAASTSTRIRCAQKIVTQLETSPEKNKTHFFRPLKPTNKDEAHSRDPSKETDQKENPKVIPKILKNEENKKDENTRQEDKNKKEESSDNKKNEIAEKKKEEKLRLKAEKEAKKEAKLQAKEEERQAKLLAKEEEKKAKQLAKEEKKKAKKEAKLAAQAEKEKNK